MPYSTTSSGSSVEIGSRRVTMPAPRQVTTAMDICFAPGDYRELVRDRAPEAFVPGPVERTDGTVVGTHAGIGALTVGQRSGVGVATGERLYVLHLDTDRRAAIVGTRAEIARTTYLLTDVRFV